MDTCTQFTAALLTQPFFLTANVEGCAIALVNGCVLLVECVMRHDAVGFSRRIPVHREGVWVRDCTGRKDFLRSWEQIEV